MYPYALNQRKTRIFILNEKTINYSCTDVCCHLLHDGGKPGYAF